MTSRSKGLCAAPLRQVRWYRGHAYRRLVGLIDGRPAEVFTVWAPSLSGKTFSFLCITGIRDVPKVVNQHIRERGYVKRIVARSSRRGHGFTGQVTR